MIGYYCPKNCNIKYLSELWVCTQDQCMSPYSIRCQTCFGNIHVYADQNGKKHTHSYAKFDESTIYKNFLYIVKLYDIISAKFKRQFGKISQNPQLHAYQIFCGSHFAKNFTSPQALNQFYVLRQKINQRDALFATSLGPQLKNSLLMFTQKYFNTVRSQLLQPSQQQILLSYYFNHVSDSNPQALQQFIAAQQINFTEFVDELREAKGQFDIKIFNKKRRNAEDVNKTYFSRIFQSFLQQKYGDNAQQQQLFTSSQYINYVWQNLYIVCMDQKVQAYLDQWVQNFKTYNEYMKSQNLHPTLLSFRMWKNHVPQPAQQAKLTQKYFLDNFIFSYIQVLISNQYSISPIQIKSWRQYLKYLKQYTQFVVSNKQQFVDMSKYISYFEFRTKSEDFVKHMQQSEDTSFNKNYCTQYLNHTFKDGVQISKKNYKKYVAHREEQQAKLFADTKSSIQKLKAELQSEQGDKFYVTVYNDYIRSCYQNGKLKRKANKQAYLEFKKEVLQKYDEQQIKLNNDRLLMQEKQRNQSMNKQSKQKQNAKDKIVVTDKIDAAEENLAEVQNSQDQNEEITDPQCPCCQGHPQDCKKQQCLMIGYCVTCSL